jgi:hypothetical protein
MTKWPVVAPPLPIPPCKFGRKLRPYCCAGVVRHGGGSVETVMRPLSSESCLNLGRIAHFSRGPMRSGARVG